MAPRAFAMAEKALEKQVQSAEEAKQIALKHGEKVKNCKCSETVGMLGRACDYCQRENLKDYYFCENALGMVGEA